MVGSVSEIGRRGDLTFSSWKVAGLVRLRVQPMQAHLVAVYMFSVMEPSRPGTRLAILPTCTSLLSTQSRSDGTTCTTVPPGPPLLTPIRSTAIIVPAASHSYKSSTCTIFHKTPDRQ